MRQLSREQGNAEAERALLLVPQRDPRGPREQGRSSRHRRGRGQGMRRMPRRAQGPRGEHHGARAEDVRARADELPARGRARRQAVRVVPCRGQEVSRGAVAMQRLSRARRCASGQAWAGVRGLPYRDRVEERGLRPREVGLRARGRAREGRMLVVPSRPRVRWHAEPVRAVPPRQRQARGQERRGLRRVSRGHGVGRCELRARRALGLQAHR